MAAKSSKGYSKEQVFENKFGLGMSFLAAAREMSTAPERSAPLVDNIFHGVERLAVALLSMKTGRRLEDHGVVFDRFVEHFGDHFGDDLIEFYKEVREKTNSFLYEFEPSLEREELESYLNSASRFAERAEGYAIHQGWLK